MINKTSMVEGVHKDGVGGRGVIRRNRDGEGLAHREIVVRKDGEDAGRANKD